MIQATLSEAAKWSDVTFIGRDTKFNSIEIGSRLGNLGVLFVAIRLSNQ